MCPLGFLINGAKNCNFLVFFRFCSYLVQIAAYSRLTGKSISAYPKYLSIFYSMLLCLDLYKESAFDRRPEKYLNIDRGFVDGRVTAPGGGGY